MTMDAQTYIRQPKDWIQTFTGRQFWPLDPRPEDVCIEDIAHALSMKCRYSGHSKIFYSVAEHSVHVSHYLPDGLKLWGLLHDSGEAYLPDVPRPIKPFLTGFKGMEDAIMLAVCERYGLCLQEPSMVKRVDTAILADEMAQIMGPPPADWYLPEGALGVTIEGWLPERAEKEFLKRFERLYR
jgi:hypothetical protein